DRDHPCGKCGARLAPLGAVVSRLGDVGRRTAKILVAAEHPEELIVDAQFMGDGVLERMRRIRALAVEVEAVGVAPVYQVKLRIRDCRRIRVGIDGFAIYAATVDELLD